MYFQDIDLILQIWFPILKLSLYTLNFGLIYIGDTKKLTLTIKNLSSIIKFIFFNNCIILIFTLVYIF